MRKYLWAIVAGVCVLALMVGGAIIAARMIAGTSGNPNEEIVEPAHWWKMTLNQEQADVWRGMWGENTTMAQLIRAVWPDVLQEIPPGAASILDSRSAGWRQDQDGNPVTMDDVFGYPMVSCSGFSIPGSEPDAGSTCYFSYYIGAQAWEKSTLVNRFPEYTSDMLYRISIYTDGVRADRSGPPPGAVRL